MPTWELLTWACTMPVTIRLPRSSDSHSLSYAILIHRIRTRRMLGDAFEGRRFRPGATVAKAELWPTAERSESPLLLEYAGSDRSGSGHRRSQHTYILWQFRPAQEKWFELVRASAEAMEWIDVIRPVAIKYLSRKQESSEPTPSVVATSRVLCALDSELEFLNAEDRRGFLGLLYEQFTARLVRDGVADA